MALLFEYGDLRLKFFQFSSQLFNIIIGDTLNDLRQVLVAEAGTTSRCVDCKIIGRIRRDRKRVGLVCVVWVEQLCKISCVVATRAWRCRDMCVAHCTLIVLNRIAVEYFGVSLGQLSSMLVVKSMND